MLQITCKSTKSTHGQFRVLKYLDSSHVIRFKMVCHLYPYNTTFSSGFMALWILGIFKLWIQHFSHTFWPVTQNHICRLYEHFAVNSHIWYVQIWEAHQFFKIFLSPFESSTDCKSYGLLYTSLVIYRWPWMTMASPKM